MTARCNDTGVDYVFGLPGTKPLSKKVDAVARAPDRFRASRSPGLLARTAGSTRFRRQRPRTVGPYESSSSQRLTA
jgi:hypothetical protein